jgi:phenylacetate-CoA ligase
MGFLEKLYDHSPIFFQNIMVTMSGYQRNRHRYGNAYYDHLEFLRDFDTWSIEQKLEYQQNEFINFIRYAVENSAFYRDLYQGVNIESIHGVEDLKKRKHLQCCDYP